MITIAYCLYTSYFCMLVLQLLLLLVLRVSVTFSSTVSIHTPPPPPHLWYIIAITIIAKTTSSLGVVLLTLCHSFNTSSSYRRYCFNSNTTNWALTSDLLLLLPCSPAAPMIATFYHSWAQMIIEISRGVLSPVTVTASYHQPFLFPEDGGY